MLVFFFQTKPRRLVNVNIDSRSDRKSRSKSRPPLPLSPLFR
ncbi:hypothetical protein MTR67_029266 [Solanum verrucosum]|uniref:Uncharacterized protein n=2 Tax=Solanum verrucosum TaxID=315347 RepID=A0AAF0R3I7_SOLVR|nr:hypothetical protein MTR67_020868 [Solanum verrucosum]WMV35651.1 hypothetical protein MTR67_029036 [Solanum verrucosum]WMV35652.1 hypothetical protein MTR67_029037 [Solanum verrucosum]WMV35880.1 hypothetical protein MTR67_029265 [Solanum verrucosum]WMV35881.1 hypothetical protein MTR67_029266 [Solanum verrucosum]